MVTLPASQVDEALVSMKREYNARVEACDERRKVFEGKQAKLRDQVTKFEKFIQENDQKRQRAEAKTKLERGVFDQKCAELVMMTEKIAQMEHDKTTTLAMLGMCTKIDTMHVTRHINLTFTVCPFLRSFEECIYGLPSGHHCCV